MANLAKDPVASEELTGPPQVPFAFLRFAIQNSWPDNRYFENQLEPYIGDEFSDALWGGWLSLGSTVVASAVWEFQGGYSKQSAKLFDGANHIDSHYWWTDLWARWNLGRTLVISPGAAVGYAWSQTAMDKNFDNEDHRGLRVLTANGVTTALGATLDWFVRPTFAIMVDYRYRFAGFSSAEPDNGGDFYFPGSPDVDFSGHAVSFGVTFSSRKP